MTQFTEQLFIDQVEAAVDDGAALAALEQKITDSDALSDDERTSLLDRVGQYIADLGDVDDVMIEDPTE